MMSSIIMNQIARLLRVRTAPVLVYISQVKFDVTLNPVLLKDDKRAESIVALYKHVGILKNTREVPREARAVGEYLSHFSNVLKNSKVLIFLIYYLIFCSE